MAVHKDSFTPHNLIQQGGLNRRETAHETHSTRNDSTNEAEAGCPSTASHHWRPVAQHRQCLVTAKTISAGIEDQKFRLRWTLPQSHGPPVAIRIDSALLNCSTV